ncbi:MAG: crosslink repair DNA glycosylase YcaQ family protein [Deinococcales bacterium]
MPHKLSSADARCALINYHFSQQNLQSCFEHLGSVQFDPLKPLGCNHDLVLQARVEGYRVDDWQKLAYQDRFVYDAWDKQASLVLMQDWPFRRIYHDWHRPGWEGKVLKVHARAVQEVLAELKDRGPLASQDFNYQEHIEAWEGSWYGPKLVKNILRALWHTGEILTHHRRKGKHVYDLCENIVPSELLKQEKPSAEEACRWLILKRHQATGLLSPKASPEVWSLYIAAKERQKLIEGLVADGELLAIEIEGERYHARPDFLSYLDKALETKARLLAPLDPLLWDRKAVLKLFNFDYIWEVYKPEKDRKWGYYVLPILYQDRFVARLDSRLKDGIWQMYQWHWEEGVSLDAQLHQEIITALKHFRHYLAAYDYAFEPHIEPKVKELFDQAFQKI